MARRAFSNFAESAKGWNLSENSTHPRLSDSIPFHWWILELVLLIEGHVFFNLSRTSAV
ncbi:hypothetical protein M501DRAFT_997119 [Patellaria atrata CBS 101060]|uniref:Uncharacterized protein n=1 Tax=Patellaria atrata CBS 101060 TaxID=1346257 RepID=A0A9P4VM76_9PEZI|nr:hypothetical protein M501DRAFT_997119 [Patellaria atrata CBS 101060]